MMLSLIFVGIVILLGCFAVPNLSRILAISGLTAITLIVLLKYWMIVIPVLAISTCVGALCNTEEEG